MMTKDCPPENGGHLKHEIGGENPQSDHHRHLCRLVRMVRGFQAEMNNVFLEGMYWLTKTCLPAQFIESANKGKNTFASDQWEDRRRGRQGEGGEADMGGWSHTQAGRLPGHDNKDVDDNCDDDEKEDDDDDVDDGSPSLARALLVLERRELRLGELQGGRPEYSGAVCGLGGQGELGQHLLFVLGSRDRQDSAVEGGGGAHLVDNEGGSQGWQRLTKRSAFIFTLSLSLHIREYLRGWMFQPNSILPKLIWRMSTTMKIF